MNEIIDNTLLELFRAEIENHTSVLENGLLDLEKEQTPERINPLMRAAHSIKGAARIVGLDLAVVLAHAMEDLLTTVQDGKLLLNSKDIDVLLESNDIFKILKNGSLESIPNLLDSSKDTIESLTTKLHQVIKKESSIKEEPNPTQDTSNFLNNDSPSIDTTKEQIKISIEDSLASNHKKPEKLNKTSEEIYVKVATTNLNKVMAYASESYVQVNNAYTLEKDILNAKNKIMDLITELESIDIIRKDSKGIEEKFSNSLQLAYASLREITQCYDKFENLTMKLDSVSDRLYDATLKTRMEPFAEGTFDFKRNVRDLAKELSKDVELQIVGNEVNVDRDILEKLQPPLIHLLRNAVDHGIEKPEIRLQNGKNSKGTITIKASHSEGHLIICVSDDGAGIDSESLRENIVKKGYISEELSYNLSKNELYEFLFLPRFSTKENISEISGRGVGLDVVFNMVHEVGGVINIDSEKGKGTTFTLRLPLTLSVIKTILVTICNEIYALPINNIERIYKIPFSEVNQIENNYYYNVSENSNTEENIGLIYAQKILYNKMPESHSAKLTVIVLSDRQNKYGFLVDSIIGQNDLVVMPLDRRLGTKIPLITAGSILDDGSVVIILDTEDLVRAMDSEFNKKDNIISSFDNSIKIRKKILVVDDSITVRELQRKLLEKKGYEVTLGIDGVDGWNIANKSDFDLVISDIDMPRMNGIELVKRLKNHKKYKDIPIMIVSYKDREEDKIAGKNAGANYYLTKSSFADDSFIEAVEDLIGECV